MDLEQQVHLAAIAALEEAEIQANAATQRRVYQYNDPLLCLTDEQFRKNYRLTKALAEDLINELEPFIAAPSRSSALSVSRKVLTALRFYASGSYQMDIGHNINNAVSQASVSKCITEVTNALNRPEIFTKYVKFPDNLEELERLRNEFFEKFNFPGVIGCVDCTHVAIFPPSANNEMNPEHLYINRKNYHSINTQLICDTSFKILNVIARFPGGTHDSFIWNNSNVSTFMRNLHAAGHTSFSLLGDSGYALRSWLLTPVQNPLPNTPAFHYNEAHRRTRSLIEQCNGLLKSRFRCLFKHRVLHYSPDRAGLIINACVVLHNICVINNLANPMEHLEEAHHWDFGIYDNFEIPDFEQNNRVLNEELRAGRNKRDQIINTHFR